MKLSVRKNSDIKYVVLHYTEREGNVLGTEYNRDYNKVLQFGIPYDIIINKNGTIDLGPRWLFSPNADMFRADVSAAEIMKYTVHHLSRASEVQLYNEQAVHIAVAGDFNNESPTVYQENALVNVLVEFVLDGVSKDTGILYHSDIVDTPCPGINFFAKGSTGSGNGLLGRLMDKLRGDGRFNTSGIGGGGLPFVPVNPNFVTPSYFIEYSYTSTTFTLEWGNPSLANQVDHYNLYIIGWVKDPTITGVVPFLQYVYSPPTPLKVVANLASGSVVVGAGGTATYSSNWIRYQVINLVPGYPYDFTLTSVLTSGVEVSTL